MKMVDAFQCDWCDKLIKIANKKLIKSTVQLSENWPFTEHQIFFRSRHQFCDRECLLKYINCNPGVGKPNA